MNQDFLADIEMIGRISAVPTILDVVCATTGMGFAAVARVTDGRWIACGVKDTIAFGLAPGGELAVETTICHEIRQTGQAVVIDHVGAHEVYCNHPTPALYGFQSYISMPIVLPDGRFFGTLCAIDPLPHVLNTPAIIGMFKLFAEMIAFQIDAYERTAASEASLAQERETATLREQFIAVLGHDLRNPLAAIAAGIAMLQNSPLTEKAQLIAGLAQNSVRRMSGLIENVLDFARGRLGDGIPVRLEPDNALEKTLVQVVNELKASWPDRVIADEIDLPAPVTCDSGRLGQLLSNLLGNAVTHGAEDRPIVVRAAVAADVLTVSVANGGDPIPPAALEKLFQPFFRGTVSPNQQGLGLGLYIACEIAKAHNGTLTVHSTPEETRFTFQMPA